MSRTAKKPPPATPPSIESKPKYEHSSGAILTEDQANLVQSIHSIETIMDSALGPDFAATPAQLRDVAEMVLTDMLFRKVTPPFWMKHAPLAFSLIGLCEQVSAEARMSRAEGVSDEAKKTMRSAIDISIKEISAVRTKLVAAVEQLKQCPIPGVNTVH